VGCEDLTDEELVAAFETCTLAKKRFHHSDHIRLAWLYTGRYGPGEAERRFLAGIRRLAEHFGVPEKFHHTVTVAWMRLVSSRRPGFHRPGQVLYSEWIAANQDLLKRDLLSHFYSPQALSTSRARYGWQEPDLQRLPDTDPPEPSVIS